MSKLSPSEEKLVPIKNFLLEHSTYQVTDPFHLEFRVYDDNLIESKEFKELLIQNKTPNRSFSVRWAEHEINITLHKNELFWYSRLLPTDKIEFIPLIDITSLNCDRALNGTDIKTMEYALILAFQPEGNLAGIKTPFKY